jgi:AcrR family transcriptional regulator
MTDTLVKPEPLSKSRPARDARREAILDVAQQVFLEEGLAAASMSSIAARLGGSKGTLYNYFKSKDELFEAYVQRRCVFNQQEIHFGPVVEGSVREGLTRLGRAFLRSVLSDDNLRHFRLITAEAERSPEIGRAFYEAGPLRGATRLAVQLQAWVEEGRLKLKDPVVAAHHFLGLCQNRYFKARLCNAIPELTKAQIESEADAAVETFLLAFGTETSR